MSKEKVIKTGRLFTAKANNICYQNGAWGKNLIKKTKSKAPIKILIKKIYDIYKKIVNVKKT